MMLNIQEYVSLRSSCGGVSKAYSKGSGSARPGTNSAPESTRPRVNSAGSTRPVYFPYGESGYHICK